MTAEAELIAAIVDAPDEDAPRLVYADWLSDRGDPRGELIALQCERARTPWYEPRHAALDARVEALLAAHRARWAGELAPFVEYRRGMIEGIRGVDLGRLWVADAILDRHPLVHRMSIAADPRELEGWPALERVDALELTGALIEHAIGVLRERGRGLRELHLRDDTDGRFVIDGILEALARGVLPALRRLSLRPARYSGVRPPGRDGHDALARLCETLTHLSLDRCEVGNQGAEVIAGAPGALRGLSLRTVGLGPDGAAALAESPHLDALEWLDVSDNPLGPQGYRALQESPMLPPDVRIFVDPAPASPMPRLRVLPAGHPRGDDFAVEARP